METIKRNGYFLSVIAPPILWFIYGVTAATNSSLYLSIQDRLVPSPGFSFGVLVMLGVWMTVALYPCLLYLTLMIRIGGSSWKESFEAMGPFLVMMPLIGFLGVALLVLGGVFRIICFLFVLGALLWYPGRWLWNWLRRI